MFRLTESQGLDLLSLARNARTSVEMIDRFYAKHLTAEMNVDLIQSSRNESLRTINDAETTRVKAKTQHANASDEMKKKTRTTKKSKQTNPTEPQSEVDDVQETP